MSFLSYAQNFEDVILYRVFKDIESFFYIDIDAKDPVYNSITNAFYQLGGHGINVLHSASIYQSFVKQRVNDVNLYEDYDISDVSAVTINNICKKDSIKNIHLLKVPCKFQMSAFFDNQKIKNIRPWVIVCEVFKSHFDAVENEDFESDNIDLLILDNDYSCVHFDGFNKFYVANEYQCIIRDLKRPISSADDFVTSDFIIIENKLSDKKLECDFLAKKIVTLESLLSEKDHQLDEMKVNLEDSNALINDMYCSTSWKLSLPVRYLGSFNNKLKGLAVRNLISVPKKIIKIILKKVMVYLYANPTLKRKIIYISKKLGLFNLLRRIYVGFYTNSNADSTFAELKNNKKNYAIMRTVSSEKNMDIEERYERIKIELDDAEAERNKNGI